jgi:uncharacterized protein YbbC (DUF1343 family)|tara:strand:- start:897 stop:2141 length:1245 start_codon:yes stop_codon:yes gene_type:complete
MIRASEFLGKVLLIILVITACSSQIVQNNLLENKVEVPSLHELPTKVGAENTVLYLSKLKGKRVGIVSNQTSMINGVHLVDTLISLGVNLTVVFSPEHGFRGDHDAGAQIKHGVDAKTGLPIFSLHGKTKKPSASIMDSVDIIVFDIQDVGVRFYTYISTLHYVMESVAENNKEIIILDRPNPNAHYIDGPVLQPKYKSFIGMHPVPIVYGMTIGEYGKMINGEFWLKDSVQANLTVVPLKNWNYSKVYELPILPSPNLPNQLSIYLYPSLCLFEGTEVSVGRGTKFPFQVYGHPGFTKELAFSFKPKSIPGKSKYPKFENKNCFGEDCRFYPIDSIRKEARLNFSYLEDAIQNIKPEKSFFARENFFNLLIGNDTVLKHFKKHKALTNLPLSWKSDVEEFKIIRSKYLLYKID